MPALNKNSFKAPKLRTLKVDLPEFGEGSHVFMRDILARDLQELRLNFKDLLPDAFYDFEFSLLAKVLVDEKGNPLFANKEEVRELTDFTIDQIQKLVGIALDFLGLKTPKNP